MEADELGQQLHDRLTRGAVLSTEEHAQLERWYAQQDQEEDAALTRTPASSTLVRVRTQVDDAIHQLQVVAQRIQTQTTENEAAKQEITALQRQLAQRAAMQPV
jgi:hypothetical protein